MWLIAIPPLQFTLRFRPFSPVHGRFQFFFTQFEATSRPLEDKLQSWAFQKLFDLI